MIDAIVLFEQMIEHPLLKKQAFVIFFNKKDVYEKKVKKVNIVDFFPEYHGKPQSVSQGIKFFHSKFLANVKERKVTSHITCCTDTNLMKTIVAAVVRKESVKINKDIEKYLKEEKRTYEQYKREPKLLLLGSSDSGKSTLLKQMKILHGSGFSKEEKERSAVNIRKNIYDAINVLVRECTPEKYADLFKALSELDEDGSSALPPEMGEHIHNLWNEKEVQETFARIGPKMLPDTTEYRFLKADYDPTNEGKLEFNEDVLMLRTVTQHISCNVFQLDRTRLHMFDVSGLKHHRKQWIPYFDDVAAILYIVSLSSYDQTMVEDPTVNRMVDALVLFDQIVNNPALSKPDIILFFNKKDLYEKKVKKIPINEFFPEYQGNYS
ncbi:hypothetical protein HK103_005766 [Boothiomyces macroporosus]|uniref:Uncharacterized protein n=1 Tax=Boothiomyces macroporosus TaxID=261099 RepID=A0AAD5Y344_9FUNG|nr:hypothetical protein HK103_005766 [Boothiomyces macroporosus]